MTAWKRMATAVAALAMLGALGAPAAADQGRRISSATGIATIGGERYGVDVIFEVPRGQSRAEAAERALARLGARPIAAAKLGSQGFTDNGLTWPGAAVTQQYNPAGQPSSSALTAFTASQATWNAAPDSTFTFSYGGTTTRCPSLVSECPGQQVTDGQNDVGWAALSPGTLGVTWYTTSGSPEADMAMSTRYNWSFTCGNVNGAIDAQSVFLHENGHVVGLGHSSLTSAVMYPSYQEARCNLAADDLEGVTYKYPAHTGTVTGTVRDQNGNPVSSASVSLGGTSLSATTNGNGVYAIAGVPYPVTYDITAQKSRTSSTTRTTVDQATETVNFTLQVKTKGGGKPGGGGDGGGGDLCTRKPDHPKC